jgi:hypothetical protein
MFSPYKMNPHHMDGEIAVFTTEQIDLLGPPEYYGHSKFYVINNTESPMVMDYGMENGDGRNKFRPIHRYNRLERFTSVICTLLGGKEAVPQEVLDTTFLAESWEDCRLALKAGGFQVLLLKDSHSRNIIIISPPSCISTGSQNQLPSI